MSWKIIIKKLFARNIRILRMLLQGKLRDPTKLQRLKKILKRFPWLRKQIHRVIIYSRNISMNYAPINFYTFQDAAFLTTQWCKRIPSHFDVIIGMPRSGLFIATVIASHLGIPLASPEGYSRGELWMTKDKLLDRQKYNRVLIVDDTLATGRRIIPVINQIKRATPGVKVEVGSLFKFTNCTTGIPIDHWHSPIVFPAIYEWNILSAGWMFGPLISDMDGVLCQDCPVDCDDDGERYVEWMKNAIPLMIPTFTINVIATARMEKYRAITEEWLKSYGVHYDELRMMPNINLKDRTTEMVITFKSNIVRDFKPFWMWESDGYQAKEIFRRTGIHVLDIQNMKLY